MDDMPIASPFDELTQTRELMLLKTALPFMDASAQKQLCLLISYLQLNQCRRLCSLQTPALSACSIPPGVDRISAMLSAIKDYCSPNEQESIDTMLNLLCVMNNYKTMLN